MTTYTDTLQAENSKLRRALADAIPWIGENRTGPSWATEDAKRRNETACVEALEFAISCFPEGFIE